jgi:Ni/Co efflux regulator RcnB
MKKLLTLLFAAALAFSMTSVAQTSGGDMSKDKETKKEEKKEKKHAKKAAKKAKKAEKKEGKEKKDDTAK